MVMRNRKLKRILIFTWKELKSACEQIKAYEKDSSIHCISFDLQQIIQAPHWNINEQWKFYRSVVRRWKLPMDLLR
jgi:hypothetical protein